MVPADVKRSLDELLEEQQRISLETAVQLFAERPASGAGPYQSLIPFAQPGPGQQYRFEVDLDACSGCKSCVTACHHLNGLDPDEAWRRVGSLEQTRAGALPLSQTITSACHHCLEPACALGCPVQAYEKDPVTGIVRHLDDQCIGCQYCQMMCPYDVPVYNQRLGIVRKCDMCQSRLAGGEAPACVQACPTEAIRIGVVEKTALGGPDFLPASADPQLTGPSTLYKKSAPLPADLRAADHFLLQAGAPHQALVWMLLLSQAGVGMLLWEALAVALHGYVPARVTAVAVSLVLLSLALASFHLGRPLKAWRFMLGLRTSWMSREILAFNIFLLLALAEFLTTRLPAAAWTPGKTLLLGSGLCGVFCSCMIYIKTERAYWSRFRCFLRFGGSTLLLGLLGFLLLTRIPGGVPSLAIASDLLLISLALLFGKCLLEAREHWPAQRPLMQLRALWLQWKILGRWTLARWMAAWIAASALILALVQHQGAGTGLITVAVAAALIGEYCERSLFFRSAPARGMPGL